MHFLPLLVLCVFGVLAAFVSGECVAGKYNSAGSVSSLVNVNWSGTTSTVAYGTVGGIKYQGSGSWGTAYADSEQALTSATDSRRGIKFQYDGSVPSQIDMMIGLACGTYTSRQLIYDRDGCYYAFYFHVGIVQLIDPTIGGYQAHQSSTSFDYLTDVFEVRVSTSGLVEYVRNGNVLYTSKQVVTQYPLRAHACFSNTDAFSLVQWSMDTSNKYTSYADSTQTITSKDDNRHGIRFKFGAGNAVDDEIIGLSCGDLKATSKELIYTFSSCFYAVYRQATGASGVATVRVRQPGNVLFDELDLTADWANDVFDITVQQNTQQVNYLKNGVSFFNSTVPMATYPVKTHIAMGASGSIQAVSWKISTTTAVCSDCLGGTFAPSPGSDTCTPCPASTMSLDGATACAAPSAAPSHAPTTQEPTYAPTVAPTTAACAPGTYYTHGSSDATSSLCPLCPAGKFNPLSGKVTACSTCMAGTYALEGSSVCTPCHANTFSPTAAAGTCTPCAAGSASPPGQASCEPCPAGYAALSGQSCQLCAAGSMSEVGASNCKGCESGKFSRVSATECISCPGGFYALPGQPCEPCAEGTYSTAGASLCSPCADGQYSGKAASVCSGCTA